MSLRWGQWTWRRLQGYWMTSISTELQTTSHPCILRKTFCTSSCWRNSQEGGQTTSGGGNLRDELKEVRRQLRGQKEAMKENVWTVPNGLCIARIVLSPVVAGFVLTQHFSIALALFTFAGATDLVDGWIARRFVSQQSLLGSALDPLADKLLVSLLFLSLTYVQLIPLMLTAVIIGRDVCLVTAGCVLRYRVLQPPKTLSRFFDPSVSTMRIRPTSISKFNTGVQLALVAASLAAPVFGYVDHVALKGLCWFTAGTTVYSGVKYIWVENSMETVVKSKRITDKK